MDAIILKIRGLFHWRSPLFMILYLLFSLYPSSLLFSIDLFDALHPRRYTVTLREDYSVRIDGKYSGYLSREIYGSFFRNSSSYPLQYEGSWYGTAALRRDQAYSAHPLELNYKTSYFLGDDGRMVPVPGTVSSLRMNIPLLSGDEDEKMWQAFGQDSILFSGRVVPVDTMVSYEIIGDQILDERPAFLVSYRYPLRLRPLEIQQSGYASLFHELFGTVEGVAAIYLDNDGGMFLKERIIRRIVTSEGQNRDEEGFRLIWYSGIRREGIEATINRIAGAGGWNEEEADDGLSGEPEIAQSAENGGLEDRPLMKREFGGIVVEERPEGVVLTLPDIHFVPDSDQILPGEKARLDELSRALTPVKDKTFLVLGHTADIGSSESQLELSIRRAKRIVQELVFRGLDEGKFRYDGVGGSRPVASNETEEGRARNRRVEILLLD
jgi:OmpA-OmpF porin, OOP family